MRCLQVVVAAVFAAALMMTAGCGPEPTAGTTGGDGAKVAELQKQLDQAKHGSQGGPGRSGDEEQRISGKNHRE